MSRYEIPELVDPRRRLGRHKNHDPRSLRFAVAPAAGAVTTTRRRVIPILDQGNTSACTGFAEVGALGSEGLFEYVDTIVRGKWAWDETFARDVIYTGATRIDPFPGEMPGQDTGSDGLSVSKVTQQLGLSSGFVHALSLDGMITGLQPVAGIMGVPWYTSFDDPGDDAVLSLPATARVRGGHEFHILNVDMGREQIEACNSWGPNWGRAGHFLIPFTVAERLLGEDGDATFNVPIVDAPPVPTPPPAVDPLQAVRDFYSLAGRWSTGRHRGSNKTAADAARVLFERVGITGSGAGISGS